MCESDPGTGNQGTVTLNAENWREFIPPELKEEPSLAPIKDIGTVFKSYVSGQKLIGGEKLVVPTGALDTPENWDAVYSKLGRPAKPEEYAFEKKGLPEGLSWNETMEKGFMTQAHALGLSKKQAQGIFNFYNDSVIQEFTTLQEQEAKAKEDASKALREAFGAEAPKAMDLVGKVAKTFSGSDENAQAIMAVVERVPLLAVLLAKIGQGLREDSLKRGDAGATFDLTPEGANQKKMDIMTNKENPLNAAYFDKRHARHAEALEEVLRLNEIVMRGK